MDITKVVVEASWCNQSSSQFDYRQVGWGGLAFIYRDDIDIHPIALSVCMLTSFEVQLITIKTSVHSLIIANIYRPPHLSLNFFLEELTDLLTHVYVATTNNLILCSDFNCPCSRSGSISDELNTVLSSLNLSSHVEEPTRGKNIFDVVATDYPDVVFDTVLKECGLVSDHLLIVTKIRIYCPWGQTVCFPYRNWSRVDTAVLEDNLRRSSLFSSPAVAADKFSNQLADIVTTELDKLTPIRYFTRRKSKPITKWLSKEAIEAKHALALRRSEVE